jgi:hypothetical protein
MYWLFLGGFAAFSLGPLVASALAIIRSPNSWRHGPRPLLLPCSGGLALRDHRPSCLVALVRDLGQVAGYALLGEWNLCPYDVPSKQIVGPRSVSRP